MPLSEPGESLPVLWVPFFENAIVKLGRLQSPTPVALYYNPLLDLALFTYWEESQGRFRVASIRALPGERLANPDADVPLLPHWMTVENAPIDVLGETSAQRLDLFERAHPARERGAAHDETTFASAAAGLRAALPRLAWSAVHRAQWAAAAEPWLGPALDGIETALAAGDPAILMKTAPDTDQETAEALARLPADFIARLTLDMVLEGRGEQRLLIGSVPEDGAVYVLVACRLDGNVCTLRRFELVSLLD